MDGLNLPQRLSKVIPGLDGLHVPQSLSQVSAMMLSLVGVSLVGGVALVLVILVAHRVNVANGVSNVTLRALCVVPRGEGHVVWKANVCVTQQNRYFEFLWVKTLKVRHSMTQCIFNWQSQPDKR